MDEILASIRKIIAEEPGSQRDVAAVAGTDRRAPPLPPKGDARPPVPFPPAQPRSFGAPAMPEAPQRAPADDLSDLVDQLTHAQQVPSGGLTQERVQAPSSLPPWNAASPMSADGNRLAEAAGSPAPASHVPQSSPVPASAASPTLEASRPMLPPLFGENAAPSFAESLTQPRIKAQNESGAGPSAMDMSTAALTPPIAPAPADWAMRPGVAPDLKSASDSAASSLLTEVVPSSSVAASVPASVDAKPSSESVFSSLIAGLVGTRGQDSKAGGNAASEAAAAVPTAGSSAAVATPAEPGTVGKDPGGVAPKATSVPLPMAMPASVSKPDPKIIATSAGLDGSGDRSAAEERTAAPASLPVAAVAVAVAAAPAQPVDAVSATGTPTKTLEDTVSDMLRPMLRQWLDTNMPKLVERALAAELSQPLQDGPPKKDGR
jgi:hypothetical protein